jgi:hypothetical protein
MKNASTDFDELSRIELAEVKILFHPVSTGFAMTSWMHETFIWLVFIV